jgi:hypothetical protein
MEKATGESFAPTTRKADADEDDDEDMTLKKYTRYLRGQDPGPPDD